MTERNGGRFPLKQEAPGRNSICGDENSKKSGFRLRLKLREDFHNFLPTMFKRVEKRRRKKQEEEELGLDEDMKEVLGIQDTDSEESASESDSDSEDGNNLVDEEEMERGDEDIEGADIGNTDEDEEEEEEEDPNISVSQALDEPVYVVSVLPEVKSCIVCPGKLLKSAKMVQLHRTSNACTLSLVHLTFRSWLTSYLGSQAHERRFKLLKQLSLNCDRNESAWEVMKQHAVEKQQLSEAASTNANSISRRAEKKVCYHSCTRII